MHAAIDDDRNAGQGADATAAVDADDIRAAERLGEELMSLGRLMQRIKSTWHTEYGQLDRTAYFVLFHLVRQGPQRSSALAEAMYSDPSTISRQVAALVAMGWVERRADQQDGRAVLLAATEEGERMFTRGVQARTEFMASLLAEWPTEQRDQLVALLGRLNRQLESARHDDATVRPSS